MRDAIIPFLLLASLAIPDIAVAQEPEARSKIVSVGIFRNGLAVVKREVQIPEAGTYRLDAVPEPLHGTFWVTSNCKVETSLRKREIDVPLFSGTTGGLQDELAGKDVIIHLKDARLGAALKPNLPSLSGSVERIEAPVGHGFLILKTANGYSYINPSEIAHVEVTNKERTVKRLRPVLMLTVDKAAKADPKPVVFVTYLTRGLGWAPSYQVDITDAKTLSIELAAVVRNELADLKDTDIKLIFGYPGVQFAHVFSPLSPKMNWDKFAAALNSDPSDGRTARAEGEEMHLESIGKRDLKEGEALSLTVGKAKAAYERVVDWTVSGNDVESISQELWDVFHFKNPFAVPMGAGPAMLMDKDQFSGQRLCMSAKVGAETSLRIRRPLGVRTRGQENEQPVKVNPKDAKDPKEARSDLIRIGQHDYRPATVDGEMTVTNNRDQPIKMIVRRSLLGKVLSAENDGKIQPRDEGIRTVNPANDIVWTFTLAPGEEKTLKYRYSALLMNQTARYAAGW